MNFQIKALPRETFAPLFKKDDAALAAMSIVRLRVQEANSAPCRVSMQDAELDESVLLLSHPHLKGETPYAASGPIFVREAAVSYVAPVNTIPPVLRSRLLALRGYDAQHHMQACDVIAGTEVETLIASMLAKTTIAYLLVHYARAGCYACRVERA